MKLLLDENLSYRLAQKLHEVFPGITQVRLVGLEQASDRDVWQYAKTHGYVVVTLDSDFYELGLSEGSPPKVIWLRCNNSSTRYVADLLTQHRSDIEQFLRAAETMCLEIY